MIDVAQNLCAHPRWQWRAGMLARGGGWGCFSRTPWASWRSDQPERLGSGGPPYVDNAYPDLDDAATAGVLLGILAEACRVHPTVTPRVDGGLSVGAMGSDHLGPTLGVAAARALLAVWTVP